MVESNGTGIKRAFYAQCQEWATIKSNTPRAGNQSGGERYVAFSIEHTNRTIEEFSFHKASMAVVVII